jgi:hypothetical protein
MSPRASVAHAFALASVALSVCAAARAESVDSARDAARRWVPALGARLDLSAWHADASIASSLPLSAGVSAARDLSDSASLISPLAAGSAELSTPRIGGLRISPRVFARAEIGSTLGFSRDVAKTGEPGVLERPTSPTFQSAILGQGSALHVDWDPLVVSAAAGFAFELELWGRRVRVKPSVEYLRQQVELEGLVHRAISLTNPNLPTDPANFRLIQLRAEDSKTYHGLGPGLELEFDAARFGPVVLALFASTQSVWLLGDLDLELRGSVTDSTATESALWSFRPAQALYRGGLGLRFRWLPSSGD